MLLRASLGQMADLGDLYNAHTDQLCGVSIFKETPRLFLTNSVHTGSLDSTYMIEKSTSSSYYRSKFRHNQITCPQHQLNILSGLTPLSGSALYFSNDPPSLKTVRCALRLASYIKTERINYLSNELVRDFIDPLMIAQSGATHMVFQMKWGTVLNIVAEAKDDSMSGEELQHFLQCLTSPTLSMREQEELARKNQQITLTAFGDAGCIDRIYWDAAWMMINSLRNIKTVNLWCPIIFYLVPLTSLKQILKLPCESPLAEPRIDYKPDFELKFLTLFEQILKVKQRLYDLSTIFKAQGRKKVCMKIEQLRKNLEMGESKLKIELQFKLPLVRLGLTIWNVNDLYQLYDEYRNNSKSALGIQKYLKSPEFKKYQEKKDEDDDYESEEEDEDEVGDKWLVGRTVEKTVEKKDEILQTEELVQTIAKQQYDILVPLMDTTFKLCEIERELQDAPFEII